jgi:hypothetical protein
MTSTHRPLSPWVARVGPDGRLGRINDGQERADARTLSWFAGEWIRTRITAARAGQEPQIALGLREENTGDAVAELDNYGVPLSVSEEGLAVVADAEARWPDVPVDLRWAALAREPLQLRHLLLRRLVAEAPGPLSAGLFHMLDWERVEALAGQVAVRLDGAPAEGPPIELRHWYSPAVRGLTAGLEQLDAGQRAGRAEIVWQGMERLLGAVRAGDVDRLPGGTREAVAALLAAVARAEPRYRFAARSLTGDLTGAPENPPLATGLLTPALTAAAAEGDREQETTSAGEQGFEMIVTRSARGLLFVTVEIAVGDGLGAFLTVRVALPGRPEEDRTYLVALGNDDGLLTGTLRLPLPRADFVVTADELPVGATALRFADPGQLLDSLRASDYQTARTWRNLATDLPEGHAVREAVRRFEEEL